MLAALLLPVYRRQPVHLIDVWDPGRVLAAMLEDGLSSGQGATYFLISLLDHPDFDVEKHGKLMPAIGLGGSAVPAAVGERAEQLGIATMRSFGSTEHPSITGSRPETPREKRLFTDGAPLPGVEIRIVDEDGDDVPAGRRRARSGVAGRSASSATRTRQLTAQAFAPGGWFMTGDVGVLDDDGYLAITDRKKDIIIRGGENVSAVEVEEQLLRLPGRLRGRGRRRARSQARRAWVRVPPHAARHRPRRISITVREHLEARGPRAAEVARGRPRDRRVPAHAERQDPEVRAAPTPAGRSATGVSDATPRARRARRSSDARVIDVSRFVAGPARDVLPRVDGRRGHRDRTAHARRPAGACRRSRDPKAARAPTTSTARCRCRSSSGRGASAAWRSTSSGPKVRISCAGSSHTPTCSSRTRGPGRCTSSVSATRSCAARIRA